MMQRMIRWTEFAEKITTRGVYQVSIKLRWIKMNILARHYIGQLINIRSPLWRRTVEKRCVLRHSVHGGGSGIIIIIFWRRRGRLGWFTAFVTISAMFLQRAISIRRLSRPSDRPPARQGTITARCGSGCWSWPAVGCPGQLAGRVIGCHYRAGMFIHAMTTSQTWCLSSLDHWRLGWSVFRV